MRTRGIETVESGRTTGDQVGRATKRDRLATTFDSPVDPAALDPQSQDTSS